MLALHHYWMCWKTECRFRRDIYAQLTRRVESLVLIRTVCVDNDGDDEGSRRRAFTSRTRVRIVFGGDVDDAGSADDSVNVIGKEEKLNVGVGGKSHLRGCVESDSKGWCLGHEFILKNWRPCCHVALTPAQRFTSSGYRLRSSSLSTWSLPANSRPVQPSPSRIAKFRFSLPVVTNLLISNQRPFCYTYSIINYILVL